MDSHDPQFVWMHAVEMRALLAEAVSRTGARQEFELLVDAAHLVRALEDEGVDSKAFVRVFGRLDAAFTLMRWWTEDDEPRYPLARAASVAFYRMAGVLLEMREGRAA